MVDFERQLILDGDNYKQTVIALKALANEIFFDDKKKVADVCGTIHSGRHLTTSMNNRRSPKTGITPDLCVQKQSNSRLVAEAKLGFGPDQKLFSRRVDETIEQLEKYDDELTGWPKAIDGKQCDTPHDLVLLVNYEDSKKVIRELKKRIDNGSLKINRKNFAIISINRSERAEGIWLVLELEHGALSNTQKTQKLQDRLPIRPECLAKNAAIGRVEICDVCPPLPLMMYHVHTAITQLGLPDGYDSFFCPPAPSGKPVSRTGASDCRCSFAIGCCRSHGQS